MEEQSPTKAHHRGKRHYLIQNKLFIILTLAAALIIFPAMVFCIGYLHWLKNYIVDEAIFTLPLNLDIMSEGSGANLHDSLASSVVDLQIAWAFHERILTAEENRSADYFAAN